MHPPLSQSFDNYVINDMIVIHNIDYTHLGFLYVASASFRILIFLSPFHAAKTSVLQMKFGCIATITECGTTPYIGIEQVLNGGLYIGYRERVREA